MSVFFLQLWSGEQGVGFCRKSKIVASLNRQLWLVYFCPPLQSISKALKKRHKKNIFAFKIYFWCCLKQFGGQEVGGRLWGFSTGLLLEVYFGWDCRSQVVLFLFFFGNQMLHILFSLTLGAETKNISSRFSSGGRTTLLAPSVRENVWF